MNKPDINTPCCDVFMHLVKHFSYFTFADWPGLANMFYIQDQDTDSKWRVNFCPSCGKKVRGIILKVEDVR